MSTPYEGKITGYFLKIIAMEEVAGTDELTGPFHIYSYCPNIIGRETETVPRALDPEQICKWCRDERAAPR